MDRKREREIVRALAARRRTFELPGIHELSKEAELAVRRGTGAGRGPGRETGAGGGAGAGESGGSPKEERTLVIGGPGTGKTVLCLHRAGRHRRLKEHYRFLVWNHLLHRASRQLCGEELAGETWEAWFDGVFRERTGRALPREPAEGDGDYRPIDWEAVQRFAPTRPLVPAYAPWLVIDEGQDMPPQFYRMLVEFGYTRFFVAADQNQQITEQHSSRLDIETELDIDTADVIVLKCNYRNSTPVARLARAFHTGDPANPPPELPLDRPGPVPLLLSYAPGRFPDICGRIVKLVDQNPRRLVGVIAPDNETRERYLDQLRTVDGAVLDHGAPVIETFYGSHRPDVRFDEGGILVVNAQACKGLEFDVVVLADIDRHHVPPTDLDAVRKRFYVMVARARERVILLDQRGVNSRIDEILPDGPDVLQRKDLE